MRIILSIMLLVGVCGCASGTMSESAETKAGHAECLVCKKNIDLACVDVSVDDKTPRADYQGKTYYFCSDTCHDEFLKDPAKYVAQK